MVFKLIGQNGEYTKELFIDWRENSKSLVWSLVKIAFERELCLNVPKQSRMSRV